MGAPQYEQAGADIGGSGTTNTIPRWTGASTLGDSLLSQSGTIVSAAASLKVANGTNFATNDGGLLLQSGNGYKIGFDSIGSTVGYIRYNVDTAGTTIHGHMFSAGAIASPTNLMFIRGDGNVGIGTASPIASARLTINETAASATVKQSWATNSVERAYVSMNGSSGELQIAAGYATYGGLTTFYTNGLERARIDSTGNLLMAGNGTAANPIIANSTGVSGMYFPSAQTAAIAANGAIAATFSKVAGAGVALGGTTGLVFDASGSQQGIKLRATPDSLDSQTLDCYQENTWTPTIAGFGGTQPTATSARYTRIGRVVYCNVVLDPTGGAVFDSTYGTATITAPFSAGTNAAVPANRAAVSGVGAQGGTTVFLPTFASSNNAINVTWFFTI